MGGKLAPWLAAVAVLVAGWAFAPEAQGDRAAARGPAPEYLAEEIGQEEALPTNDPEKPDRMNDPSKEPDMDHGDKRHHHHQHLDAHRGHEHKPAGLGEHHHHHHSHPHQPDPHHHHPH